MKGFTTATMLALAAFAAAAPTEQGEQQPQLVHMRSTDDGFAHDIYEGDSSKPDVSSEIVAREEQNCKSTCLAKTQAKLQEMKDARACLVNSLLLYPNMTREDRGVAYCRSGDAVVALCSNGNVSVGAPLSRLSAQIEVFNQMLNKNCSNDAAGTVFNVPQNVTFWRGSVGDTMCPGVQLSGHIGPLKWHVDFSGPRVTIG